MKTLCVDCGCHFEDEFRDSLKCTFWVRRNLGDIPRKYKKIIWDWIFSLPVDEIGIKAQRAISLSFYGLNYTENQFEASVEGYKDWTDKERRQYQKTYFMMVLGRETILSPDEKSTRSKQTKPKS